MLQIYLKSQEFWGNKLYIFSLLLRRPFATEVSAVGVLIVIERLKLPADKSLPISSINFTISQQTAPHQPS
jgi:hypothetical protein